MVFAGSGIRPEGNLGSYFGGVGATLGAMGSTLGVQGTISGAWKAALGGLWGHLVGHLADLRGHVGAKNAAKSQHDGPETKPLQKHCFFPRVFDGFCWVDGLS